jgi:putative transposase
MKHPKFINGEFYHIYNRGVDRRNIFSDSYDLYRFFQSMDEFNVSEPIGSIYEASFLDLAVTAKRKRKRLVKFIAYCMNPNHYHFILQQAKEGGLSEFIKRLAGGYTWYFNNKYHRSGSLFQGTFKAKRIDSNEYLLHLSAYVNLNYKVHKLGGLTAKLIKSSWDEYIANDSEAFCEKQIISEQFSKSYDYKKFAEDSLIDIVARQQRDKDFGGLLLE